MWFGLFLILIAVPLLELALLIKLGQVVGIWATLALLFLSAGVGLVILNAQGMSAMRRAMASVERGKPPVEPAMDGFMLMMAGGLLIAPGLLTDAVALILLVPPLRRAIGAWVMKRMQASGTIEVTSWSREETRFQEPRAEPTSSPRPPRATSRPTVIEGEFERIDERPTDGRNGKAPRKPNPDDV